ncbi:MAG: bifunctional methylenetetrahydrofolate dehydrogenase/methenyltetrahydrofolate cyclohydrolase FolD [Alphaproteobacteria bacterium]|nr:bifunctional methylenetetrahydrofolate dehydrogenase/methenyltetrahydrofolate cyclohydrolase FolD [Alphaproteobacteria bacterium]
MAETQWIDGAARAEALRAAVAAETEDLAARYGWRPGLAVILVGEDPASEVYVRSKIEKSQAAGMVSLARRLPAEATQAEVEAQIEALNADPEVHGILLQLPLPAGLDSAAALERLDPRKDVDGLTVASAGRRVSGLSAFSPCTPLGCMMLLKESVGDLTGAHAVVLGRSVLVGRPMADLLLEANCTVTIAHSRSRDLAGLCRTADILVAAVGRPGMVKGDWIKPGAAVIDVGINRVPHPDPAKAAKGRTRLVGDVDPVGADGVAGWLTPVPGGVGPMTVACLLHNTLMAAKRAHGLA